MPAGAVPPVTTAGAKTIQAATVNADGPTTTLTVRARGTLAGGVGPILKLLINGVEVGSTEVRSAELADHQFTVPPMLPGIKIDLVYGNDASINGADRNLYIANLQAGATVLQPDAPGSVYDRGLDSAAMDGIDILPGQAGMAWNGALRLTWPEPNLTSTVTVRASGSPADGVAPVMALRVDGVVVGSTEVRSTEPADHVFAVPPLAVGSKLDVVFTNSATVNSQVRQLNVHYLMAGTTVLLPTASGVVFDAGSGLAAFDGAGTQPGLVALPGNGALRGKWPAANLTDSLTLRASGTPSNGVWPSVQVLVNGVVVGTAEVRSTTPVDLNFATLPLAPGALVQVRNTNAGSLNLAYAIAGKTVLRPGDAGVQTSAAMPLQGAWPQPNLTDTLTVRARGSLAGGIGPVMQVLVDGVLVGTTEVRNTDFADFSFPAFPMQPGRKVDVAFTNDAYINGQDRNLYVAYLVAGNTFVLPTASGNTIDRGAGAAAFDGIDVVTGSSALTSNAALRTTWPQPNITSALTVRASGTLAGNVGPVLRLWVDGVAVSSVEVRASTPTDYSLPTPPLAPGSKVSVTFENPETVGGVQRTLTLAYLMAGTTVLKPTTSGAVYSAGNLQATWPSANLTDTLTVRAHGVLAGGVGPVMQVLVDGVLVGTQEVRAADPTDHRFLVPALLPGTKIDVVYTNDAMVNGVDRNLVVSQLISGKTYQLPTAANSSYDLGVGAAAFDGLNLLPGQPGLHSNGALRLTWPEPNLTGTVTVRASGSPADGVAPVMALRVDGVVVGSTEVRSAEPADHVFAVPPLAVGSKLDVVFTNSATVNSQVRQLNVHYLMAGNTVLLPTASGVVFDAGSGLAAFDGAGTQPGLVALPGNGALRGKWPAANLTDSLTLRASGTPSNGVWPSVQVLVNGVVVGTAEVRSTTPVDLNFATLPLAPGALVQVRNTNAGSLNLAYAIAGKTVLRPGDAGVQTSAATPLQGAWPQPNLTDTLTVRARGSLAGGIGPVMQVLVDGVLVGTADVGNTDFADFSFPAFAMQPGRKVDVAFTNDAYINGQDRNLYVAYLVAGNTFVLPTASGNIIDRGAGAAAFDGIDVIPGSVGLSNNSALRTTWPQPNITSALTVRASGTLAGNVGPVLRLWVDGVAVSSVEVRASTPTDYTLPTPPLAPGSKVSVTFENPETVGGVQRTLTLAYLMAGTTVLKPTTSGAVYSAGNLQATWPAVNLTDTLTVRAHGVLAGGVGPVMQVLVDGVLVGTQEVRAADPTDHRFLVPALLPGTKIDVVYTNDAMVNGVDRNLVVSQLISGKTYQLPTAAGSSYDLGVGAAAFDGLNLLPGQPGLHSNGALRLSWPEPNLTGTVTVRASGSPADGVGPVMALRVDGVVVGSTEVRSTEPADHVFAVPPLAVGSRLDVVFTNSATVNDQVRQLNVHYLMAGNNVLLPTASGVVFDAGSGLAAFDGAGTQPGLVALPGNGALRGRWPAANMTDTLTLRASGTPTNGAWPTVQVLVDGVVLGMAEVRSTTPVDLSFASLPITPGALVQVRNTDAGSLNLAYAIAGKTVLRPGDAGVQTSAATPLQGAWPQPNLTDTLTVRARSDLAGGVGALMQILVDGVMVGSTEVRSTVFADHRFAVPPLNAGRKVDVVYTNNALVNGEDRNLHVAYLSSGNTVLLPTAVGNSFDGGVGSAAFDGLNLLPASGSLYGAGALRTTWPQPNITSTLTVRASATSAGGTGALMLLWVDGVAVSSVEVKSSTPADYLMPTTLIKPGTRVAITFANRGSVDGVERALNVHYAIAGTTFLTPNTTGATYAAGDLSAAWPSPNITDTLTVRAYANLAGGVGASMAVRVDGVQVAQVQVDATEPTDYRVGVPAIKPGSLVDLAYTNNALIDGADRNLYVVQLTLGTTALVPSATNSSVDRGTAHLAFDGVDVIPGGSGLWSNGALRLAWPAPNLVDKITVRASGTPAGAQAPRMVVRVDGTVVGTVDVTSTEPADHVFSAPAYAAGSKVDVAFTNAGSADGTVRALNLHYLMAGTTVLRPSDAGMKFDAGTGLAAYDGATVSAAQVAMLNNGAVRGTWPAANMTDSLTLRASGTPSNGVWPSVQVLVNGVVVGTAEVRSTTPVDLNFATLPLAPGALVQVRNTNAGSLNLAYAIAGKTVLRPTDAGVQASAATPLQGTWPQPNLTDTLTVRARGSLAGGIGPVMQVLVDGVLVGTADVGNTDFADFSFPAFPMQPGRKVDVAFTNDAYINGQDRNLYIAYLVTGNTFVLPTASGNTIDRGAGAAAFDGIDVISGSVGLSNNSALRTTWPQPNITSSVTVRASGTLAGNVGPVLRLWVDGVAVSSVEVRASTPTDYSLPTPPLTPGSRIDLAYTNDAIVDGVDRNVSVHNLKAGSTYVLPSMPAVKYDLGSDNAAFDGADVLPGQVTLPLPGALRLAWPSANVTDTITVRASASLAANVGALMQLRVDGVALGTVEVRSTSGADYQFAAPRLVAGSRVDLVFLNDANVNGEDRNLYVQYIRAQGTTLASVGPGVLMDAGVGEAAFDGVNATASTGSLASNGALRFTMPAAKQAVTDLAAQYAASRLLQQAGFGPALDEIQRVKAMSRANWLAAQMALPATPDFVNAVQAKYNLGDAWRPRGANYSAIWVQQRFWQAAANAPDALRKRVAFALHHILMISQADSNLYEQQRAYAAYMDTLNKHAFGSYRQLLEDVALSPAMGIYLSHMRNRPEDAGTGRMPDENFGREVMQLFSIGLHELNIDGTPRLNSLGQPIETYTNDDVMAMAKVFTGWSWAFPDNALTTENFRWGNPGITAATDTGIDTLRMKAYPGQHSPAEKRLFAGKANALVIPAGTSAPDSVRLALDALFQHPNVGPFIGRQLIQRLVTSHPSAAYVARVAAVFNNNGSGVRGDLGAVVRAVLLDTEAVSPPVGSIGKLREPVLRVAHWMRSFGAGSVSGEFQIPYALDAQGQRALFAPSVFGYFRPGFVPPNTTFSANSITVPEMQIVNEASTAQWVNTALAMAGNGLGWNGSTADVRADLQPLADLAAAGDVDGLIERLNLLLYAGGMSTALKQDLLESITTVAGNDSASHLNRARVALFLALASPEYLVQR